jgi:uncharacterized protein
MKNTLIGLVILALAADPAIAQLKKVDYKVPNRCEPLAYGSQRIQGFIGERMQLNMDKGLASIPYYSYLRAYQRGVEAFWPAGEYLGKFSQALMYSHRYTGDQSQLEQTQRIIDTWVEAQQPDGYVASNPKGYATGPRWDAWAVWDHKYTLLGLLDYYALSGGEKRVLDAARKAADVVIGAYGARKTQLDLMEAVYNGGLCNGSILEPMTYLYQYTGDPSYLAFCNHILKAFENENGPKIVSELTARSGQVSKVGTAKGYEMLSCLIGLVRMYQLTGDETLLAAATRAWQDIVENNLYITGTATQGEHFRGERYLPASETDRLPGNPNWKINMGEACVTAHWIFLNRLLFQLGGDLKYVEEIEKSLYNHLLGSQSPTTGLQAYYMALNGHKQFKTFNTYGGAPPCCLSSVLRCVSTTPEIIWTKFADNGFAVLLYNPGEFAENITAGDGKPVMVNTKMEADIMGSGKAVIHISLKEPAAFRVGLRVPSWCRNFRVELADGSSLTGRAGEFLNIDRLWSRSERLTVSLEVVDQVIEGSPTYAGFHAFKRGPYVLALDQRVNPGVDIDQVWVGEANGARLTPARQALPKDWIGSQAYSTPSAGPAPLILTPFLDAGQDGSKYRVWIPGRRPLDQPRS